MTASDATGSTNLSGSGENAEPPNPSSGPELYLSSGPSPTPSPNAPPPTGGPIDNNNNGGGDAAGNRLETTRSGMDPTAERILISVGSIGTRSCDCQRLS